MVLFLDHAHSCPFFLKLWENTHNKIYFLNQFKVYNSVSLSSFTMLCNYQHHLVHNFFFITLNKNPVSIKQSLPGTLSSHILTTTNQLSVPILDVHLLDVLYKWNQKVCGILCLASFTKYVYRVHPCCGMYQHSILFHGWKIFHYINTPFVFLHLSVAGHLGCFYPLVIVDSTTMNICIYIF